MNANAAPPPEAAKGDAPDETCRRNSDPFKRISCLTKAAAAVVTRGGRREDDDAVPRARAKSAEASGDASSIGAWLRAAALGLRQKKTLNKQASHFEEDRQMSRRRRSSKCLALQPRKSVEAARPMGYLQLRGFHAMTSPARRQPGASLTAKLLEAAAKDHLCDVELAGKGEGATVRAPSFLLACHSAVFEELFFPKGGVAPRCSIFVPGNPPRVYLDFAVQPALDAAVHFFATLELPPAMEARTTAANLRALAQLCLVAQLFQVEPLLDAAYQTARRLMNQDPLLVCAAFDECTALAAQKAAANNWGMAAKGQIHDYLRDYCLECLRESPAKTVCAAGPNAGVTHLSAAAIGEIIRDQEIDADEYCMWTILNSWVARGPGTHQEKIAVAKSLVSHIRLVFIDPDKLKFTIKKCSFVDPHDVEEALKEIEVLLENESPDDKERVIVEGAGDDRVNGVYVRTEEEIGLMDDEVMFLKEGGVDFSSDFGLYCFKGTWNISDCSNYFHLLYTCEVLRRKGHSLQKPPKWGWKCAEGPEKAPVCTWKPGKEEESADATPGIAPPLSELKHGKPQRAKRSTQHMAGTAGHALERSLTLEQMMSLPEDEGAAENKHQYASLTKDLFAMMNMSVDEGHDDEEGGYDVNYMSATRFNTSLPSLPDADEKSSVRK